ncbi:hypothetical protein SAY87_008167 [Trapa incisa]|uniref:Uncharacterized protein n=1 Tax=Trapa incisa TaxID=236973 RepID=A0AAN7KNG4_9MYRT|nr:hypothetical protein SAY87_008167 [Trapa incisa]
MPVLKKSEDVRSLHPDDKHMKNGAWRIKGVNQYCQLSSVQNAIPLKHVPMANMARNVGVR